MNQWKKQMNPENTVTEKEKKNKKNSVTAMAWMMAHTNTAEPIQEQIKERQEQEKRQ